MEIHAQPTVSGPEAERVRELPVNSLNCARERPCRRATSATVAPSSMVSSTILAFTFCWRCGAFSPKGRAARLGHLEPWRRVILTLERPGNRETNGHRNAVHRDHQNLRRAQKRASVPHAADRIRQAAMGNPDERLVALGQMRQTLHSCTMSLYPSRQGRSTRSGVTLPLARIALGGKCMPTELEDRMIDLHGRLHEGQCRSNVITS